MIDPRIKSISGKRCLTISAPPYYFYPALKDINFLIGNATLLLTIKEGLLSSVII
jgi:hypothetical protein